MGSEFCRCNLRSLHVHRDGKYEPFPELTSKNCHELSYNPSMVDQNIFVPPLDQREHIPMQVVQAVVDHIAREFDPEKIILFGSHAYGNPQPWSDVDLLVVIDTNRNPVEVSQDILKDLPAFMFSVDVLVRTPATIKRRLALGDSFLEEVISRGKILYERANSRMDSES